MVAFVPPPKQIPHPPHLRHVHQVLAKAFLPSDVLRSNDKIPAWKAWTFAVWVAAIALGGIVRVILVMY